MEILFLVAVLVFPLAIVTAGRRLNDRRSAAWTLFARAHDLSFEPGSWRKPPEIYGYYRGVQVRMSVIYKGNRSNDPHTTVEAYVSESLPPGFHLSREGVIASMGKMLGGQDIQVGDPQLDDAFLIKGRSERLVREFLRQPGLRDPLLDWIRQHPDGELEEGRVRWSRRGYLTVPLELEALIRDAAELVESLDEAVRGMRSRGIALDERESAQARARHEARAEMERQEQDRSDARRESALGARSAADGGEVRRYSAPDREVPRSAPPDPPAPPEALAEALAEPSVGGPSTVSEWREIAERFMKSTSIDDIDLLGGGGAEPLPPLAPPGGLPAPDPTPVLPPTLEPEAPAVEPAIPLERRPPPALAEALRRLADRSLSASARREIVADLQGRRFDFELDVGRVSWSSGARLPAALRSGRTAVGRVHGSDDLEIGVRFPKSENDRLAKRPADEPLAVGAVIAEWDDFYRRLVFDAG